MVTRQTHQGFEGIRRLKNAKPFFSLPGKGLEILNVVSFMEKLRFFIPKALDHVHNLTKNTGYVNRPRATINLATAWANDTAVCHPTGTIKENQLQG